MRKRTSGKKASTRFGKRKRYGSRRARTSYRSSRSYRKKVSTTFVGPRGPVKDKTVLKLRYCDTYSSLPGVLQAAQYIYRGNSCYDPDYTGTGAQPYGWDQWLDVYQKYRVIGSTIEVKAMSYASNSTASAATEGCAQFYVVPNLATSDLTTSVATNTFDLKNLPYARQAIVTPDKPGYIKMYMPTGKLFGYNKYQIKSQQEFEASTVANPSKEFYWHIYTCGIDEQAANLYVNVTVTYYVEMFQRVNVASS